MLTTIDAEKYKQLARTLLNEHIRSLKQSGELRPPYQIEKHVIETARLVYGMLTVFQDKMTEYTEFRKKHPITEEPDMHHEIDPMKELDRHLGYACKKIYEAVSLFNGQGDPSNWEYEYRPGDWIEMLVGEYEGMLGQILSIDETTDEFVIRMLVTPDGVKDIRTARYLDFELHTPATESDPNHPPIKPPPPCCTTGDCPDCSE